MKGSRFICPLQRLRAAYWGRQCGVAYAEAFKVMQASGRMRPYRVLP